MEEQIKKLEQKQFELNGYLEDINTVMWESFMVKDRPFTKEDGIKIMTILNEWASKN